MPIPLFTTSGARAIWEREPYLPPVEPWEAKGYALGLDMAKKLPSPLTAAIEGLKEGEVYQEERQKAQALIAKTQAEAQKAAVEAQLFPESEQGRLALQRAQAGLATAQATSVPSEIEWRKAQAAKYREETGAAPFIRETERLQQEAELAKINTEKLKSENAAAKIKRQNQDQEISAQTKKDLSEIITGLDDPNQDASGALNLIEQNLGRVIRAATPLNEKETLVDQDSDFDVLMDELGSKAEKRPELQQQVQRIQSAYDRGVNRRINAVAKKTVPPLFSGTEELTDLQSLAKQVGGVSTTPGTSNAPAAPAAPAAPVAPVAPAAPVAPNVPSPKETAQTIWPKQLAPGIEAAPSTINEEDKPIIDRVFDGGMLPHVAQRRTRLIQKYTKQGLDMDKAVAAADRDIKESKMSPTEETNYNKFANAVDQWNTMAARAGVVVEKLRQIQQETGKDPALGPGSNLLRRAADVTESFAPGKMGETAKRLVDARAELDALGGLNTLMAVNDLGFATKAIDQKYEQQLYGAANFSSRASIARNDEVLEMSIAKAQQLSDMKHIIDVLMTPVEGLGYSYEAAFKEAARYKSLAPAIVPGTIQIEDTPGHMRTENILVRNPNRMPPGEYLDNLLGLKKAPAGNLPTNEPRKAPIGPGASVDDVLKSLPQSSLDGGTPIPVDKISRKINKYFSPESRAEAETAPGTGYNLAPSEDIKERMYQGNVPLFNRMIWFESKGNPLIKSRDKDGKVIAEGLMQLKRSTGEWLWDKYGFNHTVGPYDPSNPVLNVTLGMKYMNSLLAQFDGNTRVALAAYNAGPNSQTLRAISSAYQKAEEVYGSSDGLVKWDKVQLFLPANMSKETKGYIANIMGDNEKKTPKPAEASKAPTAINSLVTEQGKTNASAGLSPTGLQQLDQFSKINNFKEATGTNAESLLSLALGVGDTALGTITGVKPSDLTKIPESVQPFALGFVRTMLFGFDDEAGAALRMLVNPFLGRNETWDQAIGQTRMIRAQFEREHPDAYITGEVTGAFSPYNLGAGIAKVASPVVGLASKAIQTVAPSLSRTSRLVEAATPAVTAAAQPIEKAPGFFKGAGQTIAKTFPTAFLFGAGETEGGLTERTVGGLETATGLSLLFAPFGGLASSLTQVAQTRAFHNVLTAIKDTAAGRTPVKLNPAEAEIFARIQDMAPAGAGKIAEFLRNTGHEGASVVEEIGEGGLLPALDALSKEPNIAAGMRKWAGKMLDARNERVETVLKNSGVTETNPATAYQDLVNAVKKKEDELLKARKTTGEQVYEQQLRPSLPKTLPRNKEGKILGPSAHSFTSKEVANTIQQEPWVAEKLNEAYTDSLINPKGKLPKTSLTVIQGAIERMNKEINDFSGYKKDLAIRSKERFEAALNKESNQLFGQAQSAYAGASKTIEEFQTKEQQIIKKFFEPSEVTDINKLGEKLIQADERTLQTLHHGLGDPQKQQTLKNAMGGYVMNLLEKQGKRRWGMGQEFPAMLRKGIEGKLKAVGFSPEEINNLITSLGQEERIITKLNSIMRIGSATQPRLTEQQRIFEVAEQASDIMVSLGAYGPAGGAGRAGRGVWKVWDKLKSMFSDEETAKQFATLLTNKEAGADFMERVRAKLIRKRMSGPEIKQWDRWMRSAQKTTLEGAPVATKVMAASD